MRSGREYNTFITKILQLFFLLEKKPFIPVKNDRDFRPRKMINFEPKILQRAGPATIFKLNCYVEWKENGKISKINPRLSVFFFFLLRLRR